MRPLPPSARSFGRQSGYVMMAVLLMMLLMLLAAGAAVPNLLTQGRREREQEMIWRGEQYVRGVRQYFRKNGRLPQKLEDLTEPQNDVRFMRQAYKDPMNREDGSWRVIYVGPAGQLIGSLTQMGAVQLPQKQQPQSPTGRPPQPPGPPPAQEDPPPGTPQEPESPAPPPKAAPSPDQQAPQGEIIGGNIIGVASKVDRGSIIYYRGYGTYRQWEFIWDPSKDAALIPGQPGQQPQQPQQPPQQPQNPDQRPN